MKNLSHLVLALLGSSVLAAAASAQTQTANEQVVDPKVDRRDIRLPKFPSKDFEVGVFAGMYGTQNFGTSPVVGLKAGYHITEDIFVEAAFGSTKVSDETFRQILPGGVFINETEKLNYYNLSAGWNILPGEIFIGRNIAKASQFYVIGGVGSTKFIDQKRQTFNLGFGMRVYFTDKMAVQVDMRDHIFSLDLLGKRQNTQNLELSAGFTYFF